MAFWENIPDTLRGVFNDGLDEVLIFAIVFIIILISGRDTNNPGECESGPGILPLIVIAAFLLLSAGFCRNEEEAA